MERNFWLFFFIGLGLGLLFPAQFARLSPVTLPLLAFVLFLTYLKLDFGAFLSLGTRAYHIFFIWLLRFVLLPVVAMRLFSIIAPEHVLGLTILLAVPSAMSSPVLAEVVGGKVALALFFAVLGHLLLPLSMPLLVGLLGNTLHVSLLSMARLLALIVFIPFIAAMLAKWKLSPFVERTKRSYSVLSLTLILFVLAATVAPRADVIITGVRGSTGLLLAESALVAFLYGYSWLISSGLQPAERKSILVTSTYLNLTLLVVLSAQFFSAKEVLTAVLFVLPVNFALLPLNLVARRS